jgi:hypothetical protein
VYNKMVKVSQWDEDSVCRSGPVRSQDCKRPIKTDIDRFTLVFGGSATDKNRSQPVLAKTG